MLSFFPPFSPFPDYLFPGFFSWLSFPLSQFSFPDPLFYSLCKIFLSGNLLLLRRGEIHPQLRWSLPSLKSLRTLKLRRSCIWRRWKSAATRSKWHGSMCNSLSKESLRGWGEHLSNFSSVHECLGDHQNMVDSQVRLGALYYVQCRHTSFGRSWCHPSTHFVLIFQKKKSDHWRIKVWTGFLRLGIAYGRANMISKLEHRRSEYRFPSVW